MSESDDARPRGEGAQTQLTRDPSDRQLAELGRDGRKAACPDCGQHVGHTKSGGKTLPEHEFGCFGWECPDCNLTFPSNCDGPDAPGFNSSMIGLKLDFRDGESRYVPVSARHAERVNL